MSHTETIAVTNSIDVLHLSGAADVMIDKRKYACQYEGCMKRYTKPAKLKEHIRSHTGERPYKCATCGAAFIRDTHLTAHSRSHKSEADKTIACEFENCDKKFWTRQHLNNHIKAKHDCPVYACDECSQTYVKPHLLRNHIAEAHSAPGTLPFQCPHQDCLKSFATGSKLRSHQKTHDENRYACAHPACLALVDGPPHFSNWTSLQKHTKSAHAPRCQHPDCAELIFKNQRTLLAHLASEHEQGETDRSLKKRKRRNSRAIIPESETEITTTDAEGSASKSKGLRCPVDGCSYAARKQEALERHFKRLHSTSPTLKSTTLDTPTLDLLTGRNYAAHIDEPEGTVKRRKLNRKYPCPLHEAEDCQFVFKRLYDVERHLSAFHQLSWTQDQVEAFFE